MAGRTYEEEMWGGRGMNLSEYSLKQEVLARPDRINTRRYGDTTEGLLKEADMLHQLQDTQFVPVVLGVDSSNGTYNIVLEYMTGSRSLSDVLKNCPNHLDKTRWFTTCLHLASGLYLFHNKGVAVNRISPETTVVYLGDDEVFPTVRFTDFGRANYIRKKELSNMVEKQYPLLAADMEDMGQLLGSICDKAGVEELRPIVDSCLSELPENRPSALHLLTLLVSAFQPKWYQKC